MRYKIKTLHFDTETGEIIDKWTAKEDYITIKIKKYVRLNKEAFRGTITIEYECRRKQYKQQNLF